VEDGLPPAAEGIERAGSPSSTDPERPLLSYIIGRLDRAIRNRLNELLAPLELSIPQFTTLSVLKRRPGLSNAQLARRALILPQSMIQVIVGLESRDLVRRAPDPRHNRVLQTRLTDQGEWLLDRAERATRALDMQLVAAVGEDDDVERVAAVLQRWADVLDSHTTSVSERD
jgi:DNA-binding MarR family transcriptional regulator